MTINTSLKDVSLKTGLDGFGQGVVPTIGGVPGPADWRFFQVIVAVDSCGNALDGQLMVSFAAVLAGLVTVEVGTTVLSNNFSFGVASGADRPREIVSVLSTEVWDVGIGGYDQSSANCIRSLPSLRNLWWRKYLYLLGITTKGPCLTPPGVEYFNLRAEIVSSDQGTAAGFRNTLYAGP